MNWTLTAVADGRWQLSGELDFASVGELLQASRREFAGAASVEVDLAEVSRSNSAGLALVLEWMRWGRLHDKPLRLRNVPAQLHRLARISGLEAALSELS